MIKLLLVTLFCVAVIAQSPAQDLMNAGTRFAEGAIRTGTNMMTSLAGGSGIVRRAAQHPPRGAPPMRPPGRPQNA
ncbi:hypothetical protein X777_15204 [Ooceraea biroi]|uniref:Uncharacterized protein n=1 Tax=Ooceraea biroi TaxID=2015173 RepID=A0A026VVR5_OOCBI|nr:hypothetical protein X777_15204 [Ooceraea biroi]